MLRIALVALALLAVPASAEDPNGWVCANSDVEITCHNAACSIMPDDGFTPMQTFVAAGHFEVCAYSGCWSGRPLLLEDSRSLYALSHSLE